MWAAVPTNYVWWIKSLRCRWQCAFNCTLEFLDNGSIGNTSVIGEKTFFIILKTEYSKLYTHYSYNVISAGSFYSILISVYRTLFHKKTLLHSVLLNGLPDQSYHQFISAVLKILQVIAICFESWWTQLFPCEELHWLVKTSSMLVHYDIWSL